jgi:hypothetical protein
MCGLGLGAECASCRIGAAFGDTAAGNCDTASTHGNASGPHGDTTGGGRNTADSAWIYTKRTARKQHGKS